jgi:hypothetical protein
MSGSRILHSYGDVTIAGKGLQNIGLCSVFRALEQGRGLYLARIAVTQIFCFLRRTITYSCILVYARRCRITILIWIIMSPHAITDSVVLQGYLQCCLMSMLYSHYSDLVLLLLWYVHVLSNSYESEFIQKLLICWTNFPLYLTNIALHFKYLFKIS